MTSTPTSALPRPDHPAATRAAARAHLFLAIVMLTWAGNAIVGRAVRADIPPFTLAFARWCGALVLMAPFVARPLWRDRAALAAHWRLLVLFGLLGIACFNGFLYLGLHYTTATNAILLQAAIPPMILIANFALFRQKAGALPIVGVILSTLGVVLVVAHADPQVLLHLRFSRGDVFVLCGVIGWSIYTALLRVRPPIDPRSSWPRPSSSARWPCCRSPPGNGRSARGSSGMARPSPRSAMSRFFPR